MGHSGAGTAGPAPGLRARSRNPYRGLRPFTTGDREQFQGRDDAIQAVLRPLQVESRSLCLLFGPSGSGKSSVVQAGVIPAVESAHAGDPWHTILVPRPGLDLLAAAEQAGLPGARLSGLLAAVRRHREDHGLAGRILLVVDQFEELLAAGDNEEPARRAASEILDLNSSREDVAVLLVVRDDFYARFNAVVPKLRDAGRSGTIDLPARLDRASLLKIIVPPGARLVLPEDLAAMIADDVISMDGRKRSDAAPATVLPALELALTRLWEDGESSGKGITHEVYLARGRLEGGFVSWGEHALRGLTEYQRDAARRILVALVRPAEENLGIPATRMRRNHRELRQLGTVPGHDPQLTTDPALDALVGHRVLTQEKSPLANGEVYDELAHDSLVQQWGQLSDWLQEDHEYSTWRRRAEDACANWEAAGKQDSDLATGTLLKDGQRWRGEYALPGRLAVFLDVSRRRQERGKRLRRRGRAALVVGLVFVTAFSVVAAVYVNQQRETASMQRDQAVFNETNAEALELSGSNSPLAADLDIAAYRMNPSNATDWRSIVSRLIGFENTPLSVPLAAGTATVYGVALSRNRHLMVTCGAGGDLRLWDVSGPGHVRLEFSHRVGSITLNLAALTPDGRLLVVASSAAHTVMLWNVSDPAHPVGLGTLPGMESATTYSLAFSPDSRILASGGSDGRIRLWNVTDPEHPRLLGAPVRASAGFIGGLAFSPNARMLASGGADGAIRIWSLVSPARPRLLGQALAGGTNAGASARDQNTGAIAVDAVAFSPDSRVVATGDADSAVQLWDISGRANPRPLAQASAEDSDVVTSVAFSPDGHVLASAGFDGAVRLWDVSDPGTPQQIGQPLTAGSGTVYSLAFGAAGTMLAAGNQDGTVRLWSLPRTLITAPAGPVDAVASSLSRHILAVASADGTVRLWDDANFASPEPLGQPVLVDSKHSEAHSVAISPDGRLLAAGSHDGELGLWDITRLAHPRRVYDEPASKDPVYALAFSPNGKTLAMGVQEGDKGIVALVSVANPDNPTVAGEGLPRDGGQPFSVQAVTFSPNGRLVASSYSTGDTVLWDTQGGYPAPGSSAVYLKGKLLSGGKSTASSVAFTPDSRTLAVGNADGTVQLWNVASPGDPRRQGQPFTSGSGANASPVDSIAVSPSGRMLVAGHGNGTISVWRIAAMGSQPELTVTTDTNWVAAVAFASDSMLATGSEDETVQLWNLDVSSAIGRVCSLAGSDLTPQLWDTYIRPLPYRSPCSA